jgi:AcrR family transcriptional regulator
MKDSSTPPRKTGRPRSFDEDAALEQAMQVFWEKGYEGSSLQDLTDAMGMNRPSLYAVFGNKENLFRMAAERYRAGHEPQFIAALMEPNARAVVSRLLRDTADAQTEDGKPHGCLVINGALACGEEAMPIRTSLAERRAEQKDLLCERFERARREGDLPADACPVQLARYVMTVSNGMAVQAVDGATRQQLHEVVDQVLRSWPT